MVPKIYRDLSALVQLVFQEKELESCELKQSKSCTNITPACPSLSANISTQKDHNHSQVKAKLKH